MPEEELQEKEERVPLTDGMDIDEPEAEVKIEQSAPKTYVERQEAKAREGGWKPEEEWEGDPELWVSAEAFNIRGEFIGKLKAKDSETNTRIENLNKAHEAQLKVKLDELAQQKDALILEGNKLKEVKDIDNQMHELLQPQQIVPDVIDQWNKENPWIEEPSAKSSHAKYLYSEAVSRNMTPEAIINHVNTGIAKEFPSQKTKKPAVAEVEKGNGPSNFGKSKPKALTIADITEEEHKWLNAMPNAWKTDKEKIQAVTDSRKA